MLLHGTGDGAEPVLRSPPAGTAGFVNALVNTSYDVWASNWRASIKPPDHPYTLFQAALYDHPATIRASSCRRPGASA